MTIRYQDKNGQVESIHFGPLSGKNPANPISDTTLSRGVAGYTFLSNNIPII